MGLKHERETQKKEVDDMLARIRDYKQKVKKKRGDYKQKVKKKREAVKLKQKTLKEDLEKLKQTLKHERETQTKEVDGMLARIRDYELQALTIQKSKEESLR